MKITELFAEKNWVANSYSQSRSKKKLKGESTDKITS